MTPPTIHVDDHDITLSKTDKELFPEDHFTKGDMLKHYASVAGAMLPHLAGRPLTLRRFPDGIGGDGFFQKHASDYFPDWMHVEELAQPGHEAVNYVVCDDEATLLYLANQAAVEFHVWPSTIDNPDRPDRLVIDIDPPDGVTVDTLRTIARRTRDLYAKLGLVPFVQATGGRGFHVVAPLDRSSDFDFVRELAGDLADRLAADDPGLLTTAQRKNRRGDRIFLDVNRNGFGQTFVAPYSLRARPGAAVATPLDWGELGRSRPNGHNATTIRKRLAQKTDPWAAIDAAATAPADARAKLDALGN